MTALARPDVALKDWLEDNWDCATEGATSIDIDFQNNDWTDDQIQTGRPLIVVKMAGGRRLQAEENSLHKFIFIIEAGIHPKSQAETDSKRTLQWAIVNYIKGLLDAFVKDSIVGWEWAICTSWANADAAVNLPEDLITSLTIEATIAWSTS